jgi:sulfonate transport system permease protein
VRWLGTGRGLGGVLIFLVFWQVIVGSGLAHYEYLPAPTIILHGLASLVADGDVFGEIIHTLSAALIGWAIAVVVGGVLGTALGLFPAMRTYSQTTIDILRPLPAVALVPIALLLFGFSLQTELFVIVIPSIWPVLVNTMGGIEAVPPRLRDVARSMRLGPLEVAAKILIPAASPAVLVGCRLSLGIALVLAIVAEMIGNPEGLGYAVVREAQALHPDLMFAYVLITGFLGILLNAVLVGVSKILLPGEFRRPAAGGSRGR